MANHLTKSDVRWALHHLEQFGDTDLFPHPFELDILKERSADVVDHVLKLDLAQHKWREPRRALVLKDELSFRSAAQLDPLDAVIFAALVRPRRFSSGRASCTNAKADGWLRGLKSLANQDPWIRRAILLSSSTWTDDERNHWKKGIKGAYGFLDHLVLTSLPEQGASKKVRRRLQRQPKRLERA